MTTFITVKRSFDLAPHYVVKKLQWSFFRSRLRMERQKSRYHYYLHRELETLSHMRLFSSAHLFRFLCRCNIYIWLRLILKSEIFIDFIYPLYLKMNVTQSLLFSVIPKSVEQLSKQLHTKIIDANILQSLINRKYKLFSFIFSLN